jgi:hypothetical protein
VEVTDARTRLKHDLRIGALQWLTVLAALAVAVAGFQQLAEDRDKARQDRQLTRQGQASERFTRAIDQLGSSRVETRIGGIYGLNQIAEQSSENTGPVGEVLLAWLNSRPRPGTPRPWLSVRENAPDVQAALSVLTGQQRYASTVANRLDLHKLELTGANLHGANLQGAVLDVAALNFADLGEANLRNAGLFKTNLTIAKLQRADLRGASLIQAGLPEANLRVTDLRGANLTIANLQRAHLEGANLQGTNLRGAHLEGANLEGANLQGAQLWGAKVDETTHGPAGFNWSRAGAEVAP